MRLIQSRLTRSLLSILFVLTLCLPVYRAASAAEDRSQVRLIVEFTSSSSDATSINAAESLASQIDAVQTYSDQALESLGGTVFSGAVLTVFNDQVDQVTAALLAAPGVQAVYPEATYTLDSASLPVELENWVSETSSEQTLQATSEGQGIKIAVISSGIDETHPMLDADGWSAPSGYPRGDSRFTTERVIVARMYLQPGNTPITGEGYASPGDNDSGLGTFAASLAAGDAVTASYQGSSITTEGLAPLAWLMNYRAFYPGSLDPDGTSASSVELVQAIDDAVADGADIILAPWTRPAALGISNDPVSQALAAATAAGVLVVVPSGDEGPAAGTATDAASSVDDVLVVGAASGETAILQNLMDVTAPSGSVPDSLQNIQTYPALFGQRLSLPTAQLKLLDLENLESDNAQACSAINANLSGAAVLIERGGCTFVEKAINAQDAGALAVIIINSDDDELEMACTGDLCSSVTIPVIAVGQGDGERLKAWATLYSTAAVVIDPRAREVDTTAGTVADFSGRGPAFSSLSAPDLVSSGVNVLAALPSNTYGVMSSSLAAAASAAGIAADLWSTHSTWSAETLEAALKGGASSATLEEDGALTTASALDAGAGYVNIATSNTLTLIAEPSAIAIPNLVTGQQTTINITLRDIRTTGVAQTYAFSASADSRLRLQLPSDITMSPGQETVVSLSVSTYSSATPGDASARLLISDGTHVTAVPLWASLRNPTAAADVLLIDNDFSHFESNADYGELTLQALEAAGYSVTYWDADINYGGETTIPDLDELLAFETVVWLTGDNINPDGYYLVSTPLTSADQALLARYLESGGHLLAIGQNLAAASDVNSDEDTMWGFSTLVHTYLGAHLLTNDALDASSGTAFGIANGALQDMQLTLVNQASVDELGLGGLSDGSDAMLVSPLLGVASNSTVGDGGVAVAKSAEPSIEYPDLDLPYRTAYLGFGLEGIASNSPTSASELLGGLIDWLNDQVNVTCNDLTAEANEPVQVSCSAASSYGNLSGYRWQIDDGLSTRIVETTGSSISLIPEENGRPITVTVQVNDSLGHSAINTCTVNPVLGGSSTFTSSGGPARAGETVTLLLTLRHAAATTVTAEGDLPLPDDAIYVSSDGGTYASGHLSWSGTLAEGQTKTLRLTFQLGSTYPDGTSLTTQASVTMDGGTFELSKVISGQAFQYLPLVLNN